MAATATKIAVQAPWNDMALKLMEMPNIPAAATNTHTVRASEDDQIWIHRILTEHKSDSHKYLAGFPS